MSSKMYYYYYSKRSDYILLYALNQSLRATIDHNLFLVKSGFFFHEDIVGPVGRKRFIFFSDNVSIL